LEDYKKILEDYESLDKDRMTVLVMEKGETLPTPTKVGSLVWLWVTFTIWEGASVNSDARAQAAKIDFGSSKTKTDSQKSEDKKNRGDSKNNVGSALISLVAKNQQLTPDSDGKLSRCWACGSDAHMWWEKDPKTGSRIYK
jgi:hypothetical protein